MSSVIVSEEQTTGRWPLSEDRVPPDSGDNLQTREAPRDTRRPRAHRRERGNISRRPGPTNWSAGQRCLIERCERALQLHPAPPQTGGLGADMCSEDTCNLPSVALRPVSCHRETRRKGRPEVTSKRPETDTTASSRWERVLAYMGALTGRR